MDVIFRDLVENSGDIFTVVDKDFRIRYISSGIREYGPEPISLLGKSIFEFVCSEKIDEWKQHLAAVTGRQVYEMGLEFSKGVVTWFDVAVFNISQGEQAHGRVLKLHNITDKKVKENQLVKSNKQLDQVIYKTTHDLRAPVMSALGLIKLAETAPAEQKDEYLALIKKSLFKLSVFIDEMHNFYKTEKMAVQREYISMAELIAGELEDQKNLYRAERLVIETNIDEKVDFYSDKIRVKTIFTNLLTNAIKYADVSKEKSKIDITVRTDEHQCELVVADNGIGIEEKYHSKIFDLFFRATTQSQGTGLGLFILRDTVDRLGGKIEMTSKVGLGTTFKITMPNRVAEPVATG